MGCFSSTPKSAPKSESLKLIEGVEDEFQKFIDFACLDIVSFPDNINAKVRKDEARKKEVLERPGKLLAILEIKKLVISAQSAASAGEIKMRSHGLGSYPQAAVNKSGQRTIEAKGAICTTCANSAAYLLTGGKRDPNRLRPRVDMVSVKLGGSGHVFCLVGRNADSDALDHTTWGDDCYVVDLWLTTLQEPFTHFKSTVNPVNDDEEVFWGLPPDNHLYDSWLEEPDLSQDLIRTTA